ncbi:helix-turn-helix domain-containing protein [Salinicoccus sp. HZC-1]|uniref:helix-turn-helix domain-containing protein n=1 Tax=Salinicoccus sp. HZC-1 TaxID=3385497 RepID=UPI00398B6A58
MNIRAIRRHRKLTQKELSERVGISRGYLGDLEKNRKHSMSLRTLSGIAQKLDVPIEELIKQRRMNND